MTNQDPLDKAISNRDLLMLNYFASVKYDQPANDWRKTPATAFDPDDDDDLLEKHYGPGPHKNGTPQSIHDPLHHGTTVAKAKQILKEGLKISEAQAYNFVDRTHEWKPAIWASHDVETARLFGRERSKGKKFAIVVIKPMKGDGGNETLGYVTFARDIPPEQIMRVDIYDPADWPDPLGNRNDAAKFQRKNGQGMRDWMGSWLKDMKPIQTLTKQDEPDEGYLYALVLLDDEPLGKEWNPDDHPREAKGNPAGGRFKRHTGPVIPTPKFTQVATSKPVTYTFGREFTLKDVKEWGAALDALPEKNPLYRSFIDGVMGDLVAFSDDGADSGSMRPLVMRGANGKVEAVAQYRIRRARPELRSDDVSDLLAEGDLPAGRYLILDSLAVAPWNHPMLPGRVKGQGTRLMMRVINKVVENNLTGLVLISKTPESDKYYDALGLSGFTIHENGETGTAFSLTREDGREIYEAYQARLRRGGSR